MTAGGTPESPARSLLDSWQQLIATHATSSPSATAAVGRALLAAWAEPHRRHHTITHLRDVLLHIDELAGYAADPDAVRLAAWYHDVVYRGRPDDEEDSARRAETDLTALAVPPAVVEEVARLVRLTATHDPAPGDRNGATLGDADLAVLAAAPDRYAVYAASVRAEYAHVGDDAFRAGRSRVLRSLLGTDALYRTPLAHELWETRARTNLNAELRRLAVG